MPWNNDPLIIYHGCDDASAAKIRLPSTRQDRGGVTIRFNHAIDLNLCDSKTDFGRGFYTTTYLHQAKCWADCRCRRLRKADPSQQVKAVVLRFEVKRNDLGERVMLTFVTEGSNTPNTDYWDLIRFCRGGDFEIYGHRRSSPNENSYHVVIGPVSLWPQSLVIKDCDQISFHTLSSLEVLPQPDVDCQGNPYFFP